MKYFPDERPDQGRYLFHVIIGSALALMIPLAIMILVLIHG